MHRMCTIILNRYAPVDRVHCTDSQRHTVEIAVLVKNILLLPDNPDPIHNTADKHLTITPK